MRATATGSPLMDPPAIAVSAGRVLTPAGPRSATLTLRDGHIAAIEPAVAGDVDLRIDAAGCDVLPGLIDLHGDDLETHVFPRREAAVDPARAVVHTDRTNLLAGITTKCHAVAIETDAADQRTPERAVGYIDTIESARGLLGTHRVHARCDVTDPESRQAALGVLERPIVDVLTLMSPLRGTGQFTSATAFQRWYATHRGNRRRPALTVDAAAERVATEPALVDGSLATTVAEVAAAATAAGVLVGSHDDESATEVIGQAAAGARLCEFPVTMEAIATAAERGMTTMLGAPNLLQSGSVFGNLDAAMAIAAGTCDVLCVDYHPPSLLASVYASTDEPITARLARVSTTPADVVGLADRGRLAPGARADVVIVDPHPSPRVRTLIVGGRPIFAAAGI